MNEKIFLSLVAVFIMIFALGGCIGETDDSTDIEDVGGIDVEFMPGAPPQQISEDDEALSISVKMENYGEYDLPADEESQVSVFLLGVNPDTIGLCYDGEEQIDIETDYILTDETDKPATYSEGEYLDFSGWAEADNPAAIITTFVKATADQATEFSWDDWADASSTGTVATRVCETELIYIDGLRGAHYINNELVPGEITYLEWSGYGSEGNEQSPVYSLDITSDQNLNFVAQVCYPYETIATAEACFSDNPYAQTTGAETCSVSGEKSVTNTVAPIQITKIVENPAGKDKTTEEGKYAFTFTIENVGSGSVFPSHISVSECTNLGIASLTSNQVAVMGVKVGTADKNEDCLKSDGTPAKVTLVDGKGIFTCTLSQPSISGDYSDVIQVDLAYNYYTQTKKSITVKNTLDFE